MMATGMRWGLPWGGITSSPMARGPLLIAGLRANCANSSPAVKSSAMQMTARLALGYKLGRNGDIYMQVNDKAPEFTLPDENGNPVSLKQFRGKPVVLFFFPKADTPG